MRPFCENSVKERSTGPCHFLFISIIAWKNKSGCRWDVISVIARDALDILLMRSHRRPQSETNGLKLGVSRSIAAWLHAEAGEEVHGPPERRRAGAGVSPWRITQSHHLMVERGGSSERRWEVSATHTTLFFNILVRPLKPCPYSQTGWISFGGTKKKLLNLKFDLTVCIFKAVSQFFKALEDEDVGGGIWKKAWLHPSVKTEKHMKQGSYKIQSF